MARGALILAICMAAACVLGAPGARAQDAGAAEPLSPGAEALRETHAAYLATDGLQLERPGEAVVEPPPPRRNTPDWLRAIGDFIAGVLRALGPVLRVVFWIGVAALAGAVVLFILRETAGVRLPNLLRRKAAEADDHLAPSLKPDAAAARSLLDEADALARNGRFAEAVHLLLFRSIEDIQSRGETGVAKSLTAREIGRLEALPARPRAALSPIIAIVERSFFGGRPVDQASWGEARRSYEDFAFGEAWA